MSIFEKQQYGAVVATIRGGKNAVEMKDNGNGTFDLTVFFEGDDMTAYGMKLRDLTTLRKTVDEAILRVGSRANAT